MNVNAYDRTKPLCSERSIDTSLTSFSANAHTLPLTVELENSSLDPEESLMAETTQRTQITPSLRRVVQPRSETMQNYSSRYVYASEKINPAELPASGILRAVQSQHALSHLDPMAVERGYQDAKIVHRHAVAQNGKPFEGATMPPPSFQSRPYCAASSSGSPNTRASKTAKRIRSSRAVQTLPLPDGVYDVPLRRADNEGNMVLRSDEDTHVMQARIAESTKYSAERRAMNVIGGLHTTASEGIGEEEKGRQEISVQSPASSGYSSPLCSPSDLETFRLSQSHDSGIFQASHDSTTLHLSSHNSETFRASHDSSTFQVSNDSAAFHRSSHNSETFRTPNNSNIFRASDDSATFHPSHNSKTFRTPNNSNIFQASDDSATFHPSSHNSETFRNSNNLEAFRGIFHLPANFDSCGNLPRKRKSCNNQSNILHSPLTHRLHSVASTAVGKPDTAVLQYNTLSEFSESKMSGSLSHPSSFSQVPQPTLAIPKPHNTDVFFPVERWSVAPLKEDTNCSGKRLFSDPEVQDLSISGHRLYLQNEDALDLTKETASGQQHRDWKQLPSDGSVDCLSENMASFMRESYSVSQALTTNSQGHGSKPLAKPSQLDHIRKAAARFHRKLNLVLSKTQLLDEHEKKLADLESVLKAREQDIILKEELLKKMTAGDAVRQYEARLKLTGFESLPRCTFTQLPNASFPASTFSNDTLKQTHAMQGLIASSNCFQRNNETFDVKQEMEGGEIGLIGRKQLEALRNTKLTNVLEHGPETGLVSNTKLVQNMTSESGIHPSAAFETKYPQTMRADLIQQALQQADVVLKPNSDQGNSDEHGDYAMLLHERQLQVTLLQQQQLAVALELQRRNIGVQHMTVSVNSTKSDEVIGMTSEGGVSAELSINISATERRGVSASPVKEQYCIAGGSKLLKGVRRGAYGSKRESRAIEKSRLIHPAITHTSSSRRMQKCAQNTFSVGSNSPMNVVSGVTGRSLPILRSSYSPLQQGNFPLDDMRRLISNCTTSSTMSNDSGRTRILPALMIATTNHVRSIATVSVSAFQYSADAETFAKESRRVLAIDCEKLACDTDNVSGTVQKLVAGAKLSVPSVIPPLSPVADDDTCNGMSLVMAHPL